METKNWDLEKEILAEVARYNKAIDSGLPVDKNVEIIRYLLNIKGSFLNFKNPQKADIGHRLEKGLKINIEKKHSQNRV